MKMTIRERKDRAAEALFIDVMCPIKYVEEFYVKFRKRCYFCIVVFPEDV